jgi:uroporphyrinogen-III synthase
MKCAVTRLLGKEKSDAARCAKAGHTCYSVHPLRSDLREPAIAEFIKGVTDNKFHCIFFTSALPAKIIAPLLKKGPRVIAIGPQTAKELEQSGIGCETLPGFYSRDFVPYLGDWIVGKHIGIPRADVPNPGETLDLDAADAILFTSAMSYTKAIWTPRKDLLVMAIGDITAAAMRTGGTVPAVVGDGSLEGTLTALNNYLRQNRSE